MPVTLDTIPIYDQPPVARHPTGYRLPTAVQYATKTQSPEYPENEGNQGTGGRRRSWQDLVAESDTATVSDVSLLNHSVGEGSLGNRRQSWMNLMDSNENLHKTSASEKVSKNPSGSAGPKVSKGGMKIVTVSDSGKLHKEHVNNSTSQKNSSRASTPSEFILVPKSYSSAGSLHRKTDEGDVESGEKLNDYRIAENRRNKPDKAAVFVCPCSARTVLFLCLAALLICTAIVIGILVRRNVAWPKVYQFKWHSGTENGIVQVSALLKNEKEAQFDVVGWPFIAAKTYVDFNKGRVVSLDSALPNYCFAMHLNTTALRDSHALIDGAENSSGTNMEAKEWPQDWHWKPETLPQQFREEVITAIEEKCPEGANIFWLRKYFDSQKDQKCSGCHEVCLPEYGVEEEKLKILRRICFWLNVPEWSQYYNENNGNQPNNGEKFNYFYHQNPHRTTEHPSHRRNNDHGWVSLYSGQQRTTPDYWQRYQLYTTPAGPTFTYSRQNLNDGNAIFENNPRTEDDDGWVAVGNP